MLFRHLHKQLCHPVIIRQFRMERAAEEISLLCSHDASVMFTKHFNIFSGF